MLLNDVDFKEQMGSISKGFTFSKIAKDVDRVQTKFVAQILGDTLLASLETAYAGTPTTAEQKLIDKVQPALAHLTLWVYQPKGNVIQTDQGVMAQHTSDLKPAFQWQSREYRRSLLSIGWEALDELIAHLEKVAATDFPTWLTSDGCTLVREHFIPTAKIFTEYVAKMKGSRYQYQQVKSTMGRVEKKMIPSIISQSLYDQMKTEDKADSLTTANAKLMDNICGAIAHLAWAEALVDLTVDVDEEGGGLLVHNSSFAGTVDGQTAAAGGTLSAMVDHHQSISREYQESLRDQLYAAPDDYPLWKASDLYEEEQPSTEVQNEKDSGVFYF